MREKKLYFKAKQEPRFRFYQLWDKIWSRDILEHAYRLAKANGGAAGVDGVTFQQIEAEGRREWLQSLREELRSNTYRPLRKPFSEVLARMGKGQRVASRDRSSTTRTTS